MKVGASQLFELQPDPYDVSQKRFFRACIFRDVKNAKQLQQELRSGKIDAALIKPELVLEVFILLAAANRAVHQAAHNRLYTRSLHAELIYSLSPGRNINESLITFGIGDDSRDLIVGIFNDESGEKMIELAKMIDGVPTSLDQLPRLANYQLIKKVYRVSEPVFNEETISDAIITRIVTKDFMS
uniref:EKC/KEOPS complex subunit cgi121 n=1 Tax=Syphacia muris TaxID=451379 RepID=A0A0N5AWV1_9BILA